MELSIVIVSYKVKNLLEKNLQSIFEYTKDINFEVIIVDNNSNDGTVEMIKEKYPMVKLIASDKNLGFSKGNNLGLKESTGKYVVFMNPDMELVENSYKKILDFFKSRPEIKVLTCQLNYGDGTLQPNVKYDPDLMSQIIILLKLSHFPYFKHHPALNKYLAKNYNYSRFAEAKQVMGAFIIGLRSVFEKINGWDQDYWLWWEDLDICKRIRKKGTKIYYWPGTKIIHHEGKSFEQLPSFKKQIRFNRGMRLYFKKHGFKCDYYILLILNPISLLLALIVQLLKIRPRTQSKM